MKKTQNVPKAPLVLPEIIGIDKLVRAFIQAAIWGVYVIFVRVLKNPIHASYSFFIPGQLLFVVDKNVFNILPISAGY